MDKFRVSRILFFLVIFVWLTDCTNKPDQVKPIDEQPKILTMSIPGVPPSNISIDEATHLITVVLPPSLPALDLIPSFTVSEQAKMNGEWGSGKAISFKDYCPCTNSIPTLVEDVKGVRVDNLTHTSYYTITFKKQASLKLKTQVVPVVWDSGSNYYNIYFPVENYYGSSFVRLIAVTKTGSASPNWIGGGDGCFDVCSKRLNEMGISISGYRGTFSLQPGIHDLDLLLLDGTILHASGAILVK